MFTFKRNPILSKISVSFIILIAFFLPIIISGIPTFNIFYLVLYYGLPILLYSLLKKPLALKKQLIYNIGLSIVFAIPVSICTGILVGFFGGGKAFDYTSFIYTFMVFFLLLTFIGYITVMFGFLLRKTLLKKLPVVIIE